MGSRRLGVKRLNALSLIGQGVTADLGAGVSGSVGSRKIMKNGNEITTEIYVDLGSSEGALVQPGTVDLIIGNGDTGENAFLTKVTDAENGVVTLVEFTCVEAPTGADPDINVAYSADLNAYSGSTNVTQLINQGNRVKGGEDAALLDASELTNKYLYLATGAASDGATGTTYTGGKLLIRLYGHAVPDDV